MMGVRKLFKSKGFDFAELLILTLSGFMQTMDKAILTFRSKSLSGAREVEMTAPAVAEQRVIAYLRDHAGNASASTVVQALEKEISEPEIMKTLRWLLQNGDLQMDATMNLELNE